MIIRNSKLQLQEGLHLGILLLSTDNGNMPLHLEARNKNGCVFTRIMSKHREARKLGLPKKNVKGFL